MCLLARGFQYVNKLVYQLGWKILKLCVHKHMQVHDAWASLIWTKFQENYDHGYAKIMYWTKQIIAWDILAIHRDMYRK